MSRSEYNNPTARMGRVLDDFDSLDAAYDELALKLAELSTQVFETCSPKPLAEAVINEKARRQYTLGNVNAVRNRMARYRTGQGTPRPQATELTPEVQAAILEEASLEPPDPKALFPLVPKASDG
jgi:hypothetical protein